MNRKSKIIVSVVGITIVLLALLGITYAYYLTRIEGNTNTNSISVTTADLKLKYDDGTSKLVTKEDIMPGTVIEKDFKVTNEGQSKVNGYVVVLENIENDLERTSDLVYTLTCKLTDGTNCGFVEEVVYPYGRPLSVIFINDIEVGITHNYTLTVTYKNLENVDQSQDMGSTINGKINIYDANQINPYTLTDTTKNSTSLTYNIINNSKLNKNGTMFRTIPLTNPSREMSTTSSYLEKGSESDSIESNNYVSNYLVYADDYKINAIGRFELINPRIFDNTNKDVTPLIGKYIDLEYHYSERDAEEQLIGSYYANIAKVKDETTANSLKYSKIIKEESVQINLEKSLSITNDLLGVSYYYRGNVEDNYVLFNNMCFRIVRIEGDGSVKIIYAGDVSSGATNCNEIGVDSGLLNDENGVIKILYGYQENPYNSTLFFVDYINNVTGKANGKVGLEETLNNWFNTKFNTNELKEQIKQDKWCLGGLANDEESMYNYYSGKLGISSGSYSDSLGMYIAGKRLKFLEQPSLMCELEDNVESSYGTITTDEVVLAGGHTDKNLLYYLKQNSQNYDFFTLSLNEYDMWECSYISIIDKDGKIGSICHDSQTSGVRPMITLKPNTTIISGGDGTKTNPYVIN